MLIWRMIRCTELWQWAYLAVLVALIGATVFHTALGLPRMVAGFLALPAVGMGLGLFYIIDIIHRRADAPWIR